jgi:phosphotransferase system HPr (HPr) family protein
MSGQPFGEVGRERAKNGAVEATFASLSFQQSQGNMSGEVLRRKIVVRDPQGLHLRPLSVFAQKAGQFQSSVTVAKDEQRVNGKSPLELMFLAATQGTELILEVSGSDAASAVDALAELLASPGLPEPSDPPLPQKG